SSFSEADFYQDNEAAADNTVVLSRQMRQYWGKDALKNRFVFNSPYPMPADRLAFGPVLCRDFFFDPVAVPLYNLS
ncbi:MAG: hypothetical protein IJM45_09825, partial [Clostridia bacterium]|nr:hypothetical protein [Clostridia bacterium]